MREVVTRRASGSRSGWGCLILSGLLWAGVPTLGSAQEEGMTEADPVKEALRALTSRPMDAPEIARFVATTPAAEAVSAAVVLGREGRENTAALATYLHGVAALLEADSLGNREVLQAAYVALDQNFFPPVILGAIEEILSDLEKERANLDKKVSLYAIDNGLPLPRKFVVDRETGALSPFEYERYEVKRRTAAQNEEQLALLRARYPWLLSELGAFYTRKNNLVLSYDCFARAMKLDFEGWKEREATYGGDFITSAAFMILSAHRSDDVLALYNQVPLTPEPLQRKVVEQIEARTRIYSRAADQYTNHASINQALRDLLYTLIEDQGAVEFLPEADRRRFLEEIGRTAIAKRHFSEAIGVYATLGDSKKLIELGDRLSNSIYVVRNNMAYVNRDLAGAIDAYWEAEATTQLTLLRARVVEAQTELGRGRYRVDDVNLLPAYVAKLDTYLTGGQAQKGALVSDNGGVDVLTGKPKAAEFVAKTPEELAALVGDFSRQVQSAVPGQDVSGAQKRLLELGRQAEGMNQPDLALQAWRWAGPDGKAQMVVMADKLAAEGRYRDARKIYQAAGRTDKLTTMAQQILQAGIVVRGVFNRDVFEAIEALITADAVDQVESVYGQLLQLQSQLSGAALQSPGANAQALADIDKALSRIQQAYDIVSP